MWVSFQFRERARCIRVSVVNSANVTSEMAKLPLLLRSSRIAPRLFLVIGHPRYDFGLNRRATMFVCGVFLVLATGCGEPAPKTDAELGLNRQQSSGRRVFERNCAACHSAYSSSGSKGPSLQQLFRKQFLPSGLPANDRFVEQTIVGGRNMMPPMGGAISQQELDDLMAYLHTL